MKITRRYEERINELFISHESLFMGHQYESFQDDRWHFLVDEHKITLKTSFSCSTKNLFNFLSTRLPIHRGTFLRQVSEIDYLIKMNTYRLACMDSKIT